MDNFWALSDGTNAAETASTEYDAGGGDFELIPDNSTVLAIIDQIAWDKNDSFDEYISIRWSVMKTESLENRKVFQKLWVKDANPQWKPADCDKKRDKALRMLSTIDANAGGKLAKKGHMPDDDELALALLNKPMAITVKVWDMAGTDGQQRQGNWIAAVNPKSKELKIGDAPAKATPKAKQGTGKGQDLDGESIPF